MMSSDFERSEQDAVVPETPLQSVGSEPIADDPNSITLARLHPTSLLFDVISHGRAYLIPAVIALFSAAKGNTGGMLFAAVIFIPALLTSVFRFFTFRYSIANRQLVVTKGLVFRNVRTVPVSRIQNIDFVQNLLHRMLGVAEVRVETASGTEPEATLRVLSLDQMERLRSEIFGLKSKEESNDTDNSDAFPQPGVAANIASEVSTDFTERRLLEIPLNWLIRAGLASNRGLIMIGVLLGVFFQADLEQRFDFRRLEQFVPRHLDTLVLIVGVIAGTLLLLLLLRLLGIGWYVLRFYDYRLGRRGDDLRISCGLFTKVSATVPRGRIQFISIHRNLIMRWMGFSSIRIETAGGSAKDSEDATKTVSRRWFVPIIPNDRISELLNELRPGLNWDEAALNFQPLSLRTNERLARLAIVAAILFAGVGIGITRPWGWVAGALALPFFLVWAYKKSQSMRYARTADGVVYRSGILHQKISMTFFERIQTLRVEQTPFDRRWKMAQLSVDTAAAGPAEHRIDVRYLDESFAFAELEALKSRTARNQPVFS